MGNTSVTALSVSPDGGKIALGDAYTDPVLGNTAHVRIYDVSAGTFTTIEDLYPPVVPVLSFSPDGQYLFYQSAGRFQAYSFANGSSVKFANPFWQVQQANTGVSDSIMFNSKGSIIALGGIGQGGFGYSANPFFGSVSVASLSLKSGTIPGGTSTVGTVTLAHPAPAVGAYILLSSGDKSVTVPTSITIPAGSKSATFDIQTTKVTSKTSVSIRATVGSSTTTAVLTLKVGQ